MNRQQTDSLYHLFLPNKINGALQQLVAALTDSFDCGLNNYVWHNANPLCFASVRIIYANTAEGCSVATGQRIRSGNWGKVIGTAAVPCRDRLSRLYRLRLATANALMVASAITQNSG